jgi:hypothetical protein
MHSGHGRGILRGMHKVLGVLVAVFAVVFFLASPVTAHADTASSEQQVVIHAAIAASRLIIVNDQGQMVTIYSNTSQAVTPEVHVSSPAGARQPLTPELLHQYNQFIQGQPKMAGVQLHVPLPQPQRVAQPRRTGVQTVSVAKFIAHLSPQFFIKI